EVRGLPIEGVARDLVGLRLRAALGGIGGREGHRDGLVVGATRARALRVEAGRGLRSRRVLGLLLADRERDRLRLLRVVVVVARAEEHLVVAWIADHDRLGVLLPVARRTDPVLGALHARAVLAV